MEVLCRSIEVTGPGSFLRRKEASEVDVRCELPCYLEGIAGRKRLAQGRVLKGTYSSFAAKQDGHCKSFDGDYLAHRLGILSSSYQVHLMPL